MHGFCGYLVCVRPTLVRPMCAIMAIQVSSVRVRVPPAILSAPGGCAGVVGGSLVNIVE
ncbi:hypothetical protein L210DRAFT_3562409, partial [Boletus edulis BED1]